MSLIKDYIQNCVYEPGPPSTALISGLATVLRPMLNAANDVLGGIVV